MRWFHLVSVAACAIVLGFFLLPIVAAVLTSPSWRTHFDARERSRPRRVAGNPQDQRHRARVDIGFRHSRGLSSCHEQVDRAIRGHRSDRASPRPAAGRRGDSSLERLRTARVAGPDARGDGVVGIVLAGGGGPGGGVRSEPLLYPPGDRGVRKRGPRSDRGRAHSSSESVARLQPCCGAYRGGGSGSRIRTSVRTRHR